MYNMKKLSSIALLSALFVSQATFAQLVPFQNDEGKYGFKNESGNIIVEPTYGRADSVNGYGFAMNWGEEEGFVFDPAGEQILSYGEKFGRAELRHVAENVFVFVGEANRSGKVTSWITDHSGNVIKEFSGRPTEILENNLIVAEWEKERTLDDRSYATDTWVMDFEGNVLIPKGYAYMVSVTKDRFLVCKGEWEMYDAKTSLKMIRKMTNPRKQNDPRLYQLKGQWGIIDLQGNEVIPFEYTFLTHVHNADGNEYIIGGSSCDGTVVDYMYFDEWQFGAGGSRVSASSLNGKDYCEEFRWTLDKLYE